VGPIAGSDQLLVTDANLSGGKNDLFVTRSTQVAVTVAAGVVHHTVTLTYTQPKPTTHDQRKLQPGSGGAYRDYLQLLTSPGAALTGVLIDGRPGGAEDISPQLGLTDIAFFTIVSPGTTRTISVSYDTHPASTPSSFVLGKQTQSLPHQVTVSVTWPGGRTHRVSTVQDSDLVVGG
jgi:hypothetical protein